MMHTPVMNNNFISNIKVVNKKEVKNSSDISFNVEKSNNKTIVSLGTKTNNEIKARKLISNSHHGLLTPPRSNKPENLKKNQNLSDSEHWWFLEENRSKNCEVDEGYEDCSSAFSSSSTSSVNSPEFDFGGGFNSTGSNFNGGNKSRIDNKYDRMEIINNVGSFCNKAGNDSNVSKINGKQKQGCYNLKMDFARDVGENDLKNYKIKNLNIDNCAKNHAICQEIVKKSTDSSNKLDVNLSMCTQLEKSNGKEEEKFKFKNVEFVNELNKKINEGRWTEEEKWIERITEKMNTPPIFEDKIAADIKLDAIYSKIDEETFKNRASKEQLDLQFDDESLFKPPSTPELLSCLNNQPNQDFFPTSLTFFTSSSTSSLSSSSPLLSSPPSLSPSSSSHLSPPSTLQTTDLPKPFINNLDFECNFLTGDDYDVINNSFDLNKYFDEDAPMNESLFSTPNFENVSPLHTPASPALPSVKLENLNLSNFHYNENALFSENENNIFHTSSDIPFNDNISTVIKSDSMLDSVKSEYCNIYNTYLNYNPENQNELSNNHIEILPNKNLVVNNNEFHTSYETQLNFQHNSPSDVLAFPCEDHVYAAKLPSSSTSNCFKPKRQKIDPFSDKYSNSSIDRNFNENNNLVQKNFCLKNKIGNYQTNQKSFTNLSSKPSKSLSSLSILELFLTMKRPLQPWKGSTAHLEDEMKSLQKSCSLRSDRILERLLTNERAKKRDLEN